MRGLSYLGFLVMLSVGINAFSYGSWWATALQLLGALVIGWFSLGLFQKAAVASMGRMMRGEATAKDSERLGDLGGGAAYREAARQAVAVEQADYRFKQALAARNAERETGRRAYIEGLTDAATIRLPDRYQEALDQEHGVRVPAWWYFWPEGYDEWTMDMTRVVFLPENMPPELIGKSPSELAAMGVKLVPGEKAMEALVKAHTDETGVPMSPEDQKAFARDYIARFTLREG